MPNDIVMMWWHTFDVVCWHIQHEMFLDKWNKLQFSTVDLSDFEQTLNSNFTISTLFASRVCVVLACVIICHNGKVWLMGMQAVTLNIEFSFFVNFSIIFPLFFILGMKICKKRFDSTWAYCQRTLCRFYLSLSQTCIRISPIFPPNHNNQWIPKIVDKKVHEHVTQRQTNTSIVLLTVQSDCGFNAADTVFWYAFVSAKVGLL